MKKTLAVLTVLAIVCLFGFTAFAATETKITTVGGEIAVNVIDDFSSYNHGNFFGSADNSVDFDGSKMIIDCTTSGWLYGNGSAISPSASDPTAAALYLSSNFIGVQVKNTSDVAISIAFEKGANVATDSDAWMAQFNDSSRDLPQLVSADGIVEAAYVDINAAYRGFAATIPVGFDGWLFFPYKCLRGANGADEITDAIKKSFTIGNIAFAGLVNDGATPATEGGLEIDNLALAASLTPVPPTADLSVIAYAAAALVGCGALVVGKKRI